MKHRGDKAPGAFTMEEQPKNPGYVLIRFYENVAPFSETVDGISRSGYEYDEYYLKLKFYEGLSIDILNNYDVYFEQAKAESNSDNGDADLWAVIASALSEGVNSLDQ